VMSADAEEVESVLFSALDDADDSVRYIALRIAEERNDEGLPTPWGRIAERALDLLTDEARHVALAAAILLAKIGRSEGRELILRTVRGEVRAPAGKEDEREAVEVVGQLGMREAVPALERRAWGMARLVRDTCAFHALIALARLGHERAVAEILRDLDAPERERREAAIVAAGRARLAQARARILAARDVDPRLVSEAVGQLGDRGA